MLRKLVSDSIVDVLSKLAIVGCCVAIWGAVLGVSVHRTALKTLRAANPFGSPRPSIEMTRV